MSRRTDIEVFFDPWLSMLYSATIMLRDVENYPPSADPKTDPEEWSAQMDFIMKWESKRTKSYQLKAKYKAAQAIENEKPLALAGAKDEIEIYFMEVYKTYHDIRNEDGLLLFVSHEEWTRISEERRAESLMNRREY